MHMLVYLKKGTIKHLFRIEHTKFMYITCLHDFKKNKKMNKYWLYAQGAIDIIKPHCCIIECIKVC